MTIAHILLMEVEEMTTHGIDVSQYQGVIDWEIVQNRVDFAILRCGFGQDRTDQDDRC